LYRSIIKKLLLLTISSVILVYILVYIQLQQHRVEKNKIRHTTITRNRYICMYIRVKDHIEVILPFCYLSLVSQNLSLVKIK